MRTSCSACLMPFKMDPGSRQNPDYCSYCQKDGKFCFTGTKAEFKQMCYTQMLKHGIPNWKAKFFTFMINFAPHWKRGK